MSLVKFSNERYQVLSIIFQIHIIWTLSQVSSNNCIPLTSCIINISFFIVFVNIHHCHCYKPSLTKPSLKLKVHHLDKRIYQHRTQHDANYIMDQRTQKKSPQGSYTKWSFKNHSIIVVEGRWPCKKEYGWKSWKAP